MTKRSLLLSLAVLALGCTEVHVATDAGPTLGDAGPAQTYAQACGALLNTWDTYCDAVPFSAELCPYAPGETVQGDALASCNGALYAARASCEDMTAALDGCR